MKRKRLMASEIQRLRKEAGLTSKKKQVSAQTRKALGLRIKQLRAEQGLTQEQLAEVISITHEHLASIEIGIKNTSLNVIEALSMLFKVDIPSLFEKAPRYEYSRSEQSKIRKINHILRKNPSLFCPPALYILEGMEQYESQVVKISKPKPYKRTRN